MLPSLDQLIQICRTQVLDQEFVRVVLASTQDNPEADVQFIEVSDGPEYRTEVQAISQSGGTAENALYLGLSELE